jgi:RNA polymerase sigma-70 factor (ECF subfamily)
MPQPPATDRSDRPARDDLDLVAAEFAALRPRLLGIAHRILGRRAEAEDVVQDAWLRWQTCDRSNVANPTAFLVTTTTRLAINVAQSARVRRESSVGDWLPEPLDPDDDPAAGAERSDSLARGILLLLQRLSPAERAALVLRAAFDYPYPQIARVLDLSEANARQHVSRAGKRLTSGRRRSADRAEHLRLVHAFESAARHGDVAVLEDVLVTDPAPALSLTAP